MRPGTFLTLRRAAKKLSFGSRLPIAQRVLRRIFHGAHGTVHIDDFDGDLSIDLRLSEHMQSRIFWMGYYNLEVVSVIDRLVLSGMVFIDAGANIGEITMVCAKRVGPEGRVIAFEPSDAHANILESNISRNHLTNVTIVRAGLSDHDGMADIYYSCGQGAAREENLGLNSLYPALESGPPIQSVPLTTLDGFASHNALERIDFIKIDIEGAELPCLKGAALVLATFAPHLIVEVQRASSVAAGYDQRDILDFLSQFSYTFFSITHQGELRPVDTNSLIDYQNILCIPPNKPMGSVVT